MDVSEYVCVKREQVMEGKIKLWLFLGSSNLRYRHYDEIFWIFGQLLTNVHFLEPSVAFLHDI